MDDWKTIEPGIWKPEKQGDAIIGILTSKNPKDDANGYSARYYIDNGKGCIRVSLSYFNSMEECDIFINAIISIAGNIRKNDAILA